MSTPDLPGDGLGKYATPAIGGSPGMVPALLRPGRTVSGPVVIAWLCSPCLAIYLTVYVYVAARHGLQGIVVLNRSLGWLGVLALVTPTMTIASWYQRRYPDRAGRHWSKWR